MRRALVSLLFVLATLTVVAAQERIDLLPGLGPTASSATAQNGFRIALGGETVLRVTPEGDNRARLVDASGAARIINLPAVPALVIAPPTAASPQPPPRLVSADFSTLYDGVALLLSDPPPAIRLAWSATLQLTTDPGHVGNSRLTIVRRGDRLPNAELDRRVEQFIAANPLPPLAAGSARLDLVVAATPGLQPLLSVWVGEPYAEDDAWVAPLSRGWLAQEPIGWPRAVLEAKIAAPVREAYARDWQTARADLLAQLAAPGARTLFGNWRFGAAGALAAARQALATIPAGRADSVLYIGAWALARERRFAEAQRWMAQIGAGAHDAALAAEARWLATAWRRRIGGDMNFAPLVPAGEATRFDWQIRLNSINRSPADWRAAGADLGKFDAEPARDNRDFIQRELVARAAAALAAATADLPALSAAAVFKEWSATETPAADWALFDAGAALLAAGRPAVAIEAFRWLLGEFPFSPLAPQAAWAAHRAALAAGEHDLAKATAWQIVAECTPESDWLTARDEAEEAPDWLPAVAMRAPSPAEVRTRALRWLRDAEFADYLTAGGGDALTGAERAARLIIDETTAPERKRLDWLALGDILYAARRLPEAAQAYANVTLDKRDDALRRLALKSLAASLTPDARRVAAALAGDAKWGPLLASLRP